MNWNRPAPRAGLSGAPGSSPPDASRAMSPARPARRGPRRLHTPPVPHRPRSPSRQRRLFRLRGHFLVAALEAGADVAIRLGDLALTSHPPAGGAGLDQELVPRDEVAGGIPEAAVEGLPPLAAALGDVPFEALGALDPQRDRAGPLALGVLGAGQEFAEAAGLDDHRRLAEMALLVGLAVRGALLLERLGVITPLALRLADPLLLGEVAHAGEVRPETPALELELGIALGAGPRIGDAEAAEDQLLDVDRLEVLEEGAVELGHHFLPGHIPFLDPVEVLFHPRREGHVEDVGELLDHRLLDQLAELGREEAPGLDLHVLARGERRDDRRVGRRAADAEALELLDQARFREAGRRLGEVLRREDRLDVDLVPLRQRRDGRQVVHSLPFAGLA